MTCLTAPALRQANNGRVTGTVLDPSGGVLPGASVTLRNLGTNATTEIDRPMPRAASPFRNSPSAAIS